MTDRIVLADKQGSGRKGGKNGQMEEYDGPPKDVGSWGDLPRTCRYFVEHDPRNEGTEPGRRKADINYVGRDTNKWPDGCYKLETPNSAPAYLAPAEVVQLARSAGMTEKEAGDEWRTINTTGGGAGATTPTPGTAGAKDSADSTGGPARSRRPSTTSSTRPETAGGTRASGRRATGNGGTASTAETGTGTNSRHGSRATGSQSPKRRKRR